MQSGIYDSRGKLIESTVERITEPNVPDSSGSPANATNGLMNTTGNFYGNIIVRNPQGIGVISILTSGAEIISDTFNDRVLIGNFNYTRI